MLKRGETFNIHGAYVSQTNGEKYKYFGKYTSGVEASWEIKLFRSDKVFRFDSFLNSEDTVAELSGPLLAITVYPTFPSAIVVQQIEVEIENWVGLNAPKREPGR